MAKPVRYPAKLRRTLEALPQKREERARHEAAAVTMMSGGHRRHGPLDLDQPEKADKGEKGGSCNRRACQKPGAWWFNRSTERFYCEGCAHLINDYPPTQRDSMRLYGDSRLCVPVEAAA